MSRSNYNTNVEDRDYENRRDRERERARSADKYDGDESRHHGKWTASSEVTDLEGSGYSAPRRSHSRNDREDREFERVDRNRSSSHYDRSDSYAQQGGYIPPPPPMPPSDFYQSHGTYRQSNPYAGHGYGSGYHGSNYGMGYHPSTYGSGYHGSSYGSGYHPSTYGSGYGHQSFGYHPSSYGGYGQHDRSLYDTGYGSGYGHDSHSSLTPRGVHPIHAAFLAQQRSGHHFGQTGQHHYGQQYGQHHYGQQYGQHHYGQQYGQHHYGQTRGIQTTQDRPVEFLGFHMPRPHCDIYELGNDYIIEIDLPGHNRDHVDIKLAGNELYVISKPPKRDYNWHINERALGRHHVERKFYLPADVNSAAIAPVLANGVLRLTLPRSAATTTTTTTLPARTSTVTDTTTTTTATSQAVNL